jgi:hypothetical protein
VTIINPGGPELRRVYLDVPHSAQVTPSWYGESVGRYEGNDTLVVDTIGLSTKTFIDNYRTPHTDRLHVAERFKLGGGDQNGGPDHGRRPGSLHHAVVGDPTFQARAGRPYGGSHLRREQRQPVQLRGGADTAGGPAGFLSMID